MPQEASAVFFWLWLSLKEVSRNFRLLALSFLKSSPDAKKEGTKEKPTFAHSSTSGISSEEHLWMTDIRFKFFDTLRQSLTFLSFFFKFKIYFDKTFQNVTTPSYSPHVSPFVLILHNFSNI